MTRELDCLLDQVRMSMEYDVYCRLFDEILELETDFEETLSLKQQNKELQKERSNMQATHQSTIETYRKEIAELQVRVEELEKCSDRTISQNKSLIAHYENKKCEKCMYHGEQSDDGWGVCSYLGSWLYLEETPSHATCQYYEPKQN